MTHSDVKASNPEARRMVIGLADASWNAASLRHPPIIHRPRLGE
jgi:hypothetical protein